MVGGAGVGGAGNCMMGGAGGCVVGGAGREMTCTPVELAGCLQWNEVQGSWSRSLIPMLSSTRF